ncbi:MAG: aspartate-semialdehyde dehydrogenase [Luteibaculaceae bacterium]
MKVAVVGVTGMVGRQMLKVLAEFSFPITELIPVASEKSIGLEISFGGDIYKVVSMEDAIAKKPDIALFSAGGETSLAFAEKFAAVGCTVIDNSSAFRMFPDKKLIIPEINGNLLTAHDKIIANPNCSTIQMLMVLAPIHKKYGIQRVVVSTYQSITGTGAKAVTQLENERRGELAEMVYPYPIDMNLIPHCDTFNEEGYTKEEIKLVNETAKILDPAIKVTATAVRVPVVGGHSEAVNLTLNSAFEVSEVKKLLADTPGVVLQDNPEMNVYPMPKYAQDKNDVFVGRVRRDFSQENGLNLWIVADNLRKGAATNAVQIAMHLVNNKLV